MRILNSITAALFGVAIAYGYSTVGPAWPAVAVGLGAFGTAGLLLVRRGGRKYYAGAGTGMILGFGVLIYVIESFPEAYGETAMASMFVLGLVSGAIVALQTAGRLVAIRMAGDRVGSDVAVKLYDAVAAIVGLLGMVWTVMTAYEKALRYGGIGIGGTTALALNILGIEIPIPLWIVNGNVDATMVLFIGCVLIGFHTLESLHTTWRATKATASVGATAGKVAGSKASATAQTVRQRGSEED